MYNFNVYNWENDYIKDFLKCLKNLNEFLCIYLEEGGGVQMHVYV